MQEKNFIEMNLVSDDITRHKLNEIIDILDSFPSEFDSIDEMNYRKLLKKAIVVNKNKIIFIVGSDDITKLPKRMKTIFDDSIEYIIRKQHLYVNLEFILINSFVSK